MDDFAKIVRASNGQQVVFFLTDDVNAESGTDIVIGIRAVTRCREHTGQITIGYDNEAQARQKFELIDTAIADSVIANTSLGRRGG